MERTSQRNIVTIKTIYVLEVRPDMGYIWYHKWEKTYSELKTWLIVANNNCLSDRRFIIWYQENELSSKTLNELRHEIGLPRP